MHHLESQQGKKIIPLLCRKYRRSNTIIIIFKKVVVVGAVQKCIKVYDP